MKQLYYTQKDAQEWASFSGDYNPIHFDLEWVNMRGGRQLSVHGMRALLDAKQFASEQLCQQILPVPNYVKCAVRLRHPLWNMTPYSLVAKNKRGSVEIVSPQEQHSCLTCQLSLLENDDIHQTVLTDSISIEVLAQLQTLFSSFSNEAYEWQFIDAVLFQYLINDEAVLRQKAIARWLPEGSTLNDIFSQYSIIQTHQEVIFDRDFLQTWLVEDAILEPIKLSIQPALVLGDKESGLLVSIKIIANYQNKFISSSITLKIDL
ncbi:MULTISPECIES: protein dehydratase [Providencia]|uniref:protein dehydratase n=1 Tax=Providencia TaxID=586 RepID=UPI00300CDCE4